MSISDQKKQIDFIPLNWDKSLNNILQVSDKHIAVYDPNFDKAIFEKLTLQFEAPKDRKFHLPDAIKQQLSWAADPEKIKKLVQQNLNYTHCPETAQKLAMEIGKLRDEYQPRIVSLLQADFHKSLPEREKILKDEIKPRLNAVIDKLLAESESNVVQNANTNDRSQNTGEGSTTIAKIEEILQ